MVFDGKRSKIKDEEGAKRDQKRRKAREEINNLQTVYHGDSGSREQFLKLARQAMDLSELFMSIAIQVCNELKVEFVGAPFEADFQLVEEQLARKTGDGKLPYILTLDSDLLVLGDNIIRYEPHKFSNISEQTRVQLYMQKKIWSDFHTGRIGTSKSTDFYFNNVTWCLFACLIGNDYTKGATNMGFRTLLEKPNKEKKKGEKGGKTGPQLSPMGTVAEKCNGDNGIDAAIEAAKKLIKENEHDAF